MGSISRAEDLGRIAVVGAGAVGAYYGARLARVGGDVSFLFRSDYEAARARGLGVRIVTDGRETDSFLINPVGAFRRPEEIGPVDWVVVGLKATAVGAVAELLPPLLSEHTAILALQNGLGSDEWLAAQFGADRILGGLCFICLNRVAPARVECYHPGSIGIGEFGRPAGARSRSLESAFTRAGVKCQVSDNLMEVRWRKLVWNIPFNGLTIAAGGVTTDRILADPRLLDETRALMREVQSAARALGFEIADEFLQRQIDLTRPMGQYKPSSLVDFLEGREVEIEAIWGEPLRRARTVGVDTPRLAALYETLCRRCSHARQD